MTTGSSSRNRKKKNIINSMPKWMKPSGTFGIGFQSIFMLTEQVILETKSFFDEQYQIVELNSSSSKRDGAILVEKKESTHKQKIGTKIIFNYKTKKIPKSYSLGRDESLSKKIITSFGPIVDDFFNIEIASLIDKIVLFSTKSYIPLDLNFKDNKLIEKEKNNLKKFDYFSKKNSLEVSYSFNNYLDSYPYIIFYKNQPIEKDHLSISKFIGFDINILNDDASEVLTINRNEIKKKYLKKLNKKVFKSIYEYLINQYNKIFIDEKAKIMASLFLNYYYSDELKKDGLFFDEWKNYKLKLENNLEISLGELFDKIKILVFIEISSTINNRNTPDNYSLDKDILTIKVYQHYNNITDFIKEILYKYFKSVIFDIRKNKKTFFKKENINPIKKKDIPKLLEKHNYYSYGRRVKIICHKKYKNLRLKDNSWKPWLSQIYVRAYSLFAPFMLSPYFIVDDNNKKLEYRVNSKVIDWVYENRYDNNTTRKEIEETYKIFEQDMREKVEKINNGTK